MIPIGGAIQDAAETQQTSRTYGIDFAKGKATGVTDGLEAVRQAVYKILRTDRFAHLIYDANYGSEISGLQGRSQGYVRSEIERRIRESLMQDDRISEITDMQISITGDEALATFAVVSIYGDFREEVSAVV
ncbi:DUF2634 domain-containing protein [Paenibacillus apis]|uniref:Phage-like element PBSX protein XkdS n=1 Tax=Paenibacillus apis TaxID=1792174 RepID=A0A919Y2C8_9BACL|nr:DUF2634 domain-containing protein [Paenibacillus apis]GIO42464.1 phage-like element PBSX protein XkdS [Paenibacillus apis]